MAEPHRITPSEAAEIHLPPVSGGMKNKYFLRDGYVVILVKHKGGIYECLVDSEDFPAVSAIYGSWRAQWSKNLQQYYASSEGFSKENGKVVRIKRSGVLMHRLILDAPKYLQVDHVNPSDTLDNRRSNLRLVTPLQNSLNRKNATVEQRNGYWRVILNFRGASHHLGNYSSEAEALAIRAGGCILADSIEAKDAGTPSLAEHRAAYDLDARLAPIVPPDPAKTLRKFEPPATLDKVPRVRVLKVPRILGFKLQVLAWLRDQGYSRCSGCGEVKCGSFFARSMPTLCRACNTRRCRERYQSTPERTRRVVENAARWRQENPEKQRLVQRRSYLNRILKKTNPELFVGPCASEVTEDTEVES